MSTGAAMQITKRTLAAIPDCYSTAIFPLEGRAHALFASEADNRCLAFDLNNPASMHTVWEHPGGTMGMMSIPGRDGEFLAIQKFYRLWNWEESQLVWVRREGTSFAVTPLCTMPYLHRFDLLAVGNQVHLIVCGVAAHKSALEDWSHPGCVLAGILPATPEIPLTLHVLRSDLYKNHGYARVTLGGRERGFVTCADGGFLFTPPALPSEAWSVEKLIDGDFSDGDIIDIDGDGEPEIAVISPFHGNRYSIYKKLDGNWEEIYIHPERAGFYHVVRAGTLCGRAGFLGGGRGGTQSLFFLSQQHPSAPFELLQIDKGQGPSNAMIWNGPDSDFVLTANRNVGEAVLYQISPEH